MSRTKADTGAIAVQNGEIKVTENAIIIALSISQWTARVKDKVATASVEKSFNTHGNAGQFQKSLVEGDILKEIQQLTSEMRTYHNENTLPWGDNGERFLPIIPVGKGGKTTYHDYMSVMSQLKSKFEDKVAEFVKLYPTLKDEARRRLNGLYVESDYPDNIESKFGVRITPSAVPASENLNVNLPEAEVQKLREELGIEVNSKLQSAIADIWKRLEKVVKNMSDKLKESDPKFKDSLVNNIKDIIKIAPKLNIFNDPKINEMCKEMKKLTVEPDAIRKDIVTRKNVAKNADEILKKMQAFM